MSLTTDQQPPPNPPWGAASTIAWTLTAFLLGIVVAAVSLGMWQGEGAQRGSGTYDGVMIAFGTFASTPAQVAVLVFAAQLRHWPPAIYLGLVMPRRAEVIIAVACIFVLAVVFDAILYVTGRDLVAPFQVEVWRTASDAGWLFGLLI